VKEGGEVLAAHTTLPPVKPIFTVWGKKEKKLFLFFLWSPPPQFFILVFLSFPAWEPLACPGTRGGVCPRNVSTVKDKPWKGAGEGGGREFFLDGGDGNDNRDIGWRYGLRDASWMLQSCSFIASHAVPVMSLDKQYCNGIHTQPPIYPEYHED
jgi:hypothetical protein